MNKKFNEWIASNFKGLSAHTLCQFLTMEDNTRIITLPVEYVDNMVYVDLFRVFTGMNVHDAERKSYESVLAMVNSCSWL